MIASEPLTDSETLLPSRLAARLAAWLFIGAATAVLLLSLFVPNLAATTRLVAGLLAMVICALGLALWFLPWERWPRTALLAVIPLGCVLIVATNLVIPINPYRYDLILLGLFGWIGLACRRGTSLAALPLLAATYLLPLQVAGHLSRDSVLGFVLISVTCLLLGEGVAWLVAHLSAAQSALRTSEARFRALCEQTSDIVMVVNEANSITYASPAAQRILNYDPQTLVGTSLFELMQPRDAALLRERWALGASSPIDTEVRHADGSWRWLEHTTQDARANPLIGGYLTTSRDVSERKLADEVLRTSEQRFRSLVQEMPVGIMIMDGAGVLKDVNPALCAISGYAEDELIGRPFTTIIPPDHAGVLAQRFAERFVQGSRVNDEFQIRAKDGRPLMVLSAAIFLPDSTGQLSRAAFILDITARKQQEQERELLLAREQVARQRAEQAEARLRAIVEASPLPIHSLDLEGTLLSWNGAAERTFGWRADEILGKPLPHVPTAEQASASSLLTRVARGEVLPTVEVQRVRKDGTTIDLQVSTAPLHDAEGRTVGVMAIDLDITAHKQMQRALEQANSAAAELARVRQHQAQAAEAMSEVSAALSVALDLSDLYALILQQTEKVLPFHYAQILVPEEGWLRVVAQRGEPSVPTGTRLFQTDQGISYWMRLQSGRPLLVLDTEDEPEWRDVAPRVGSYRIRSLISIPLLIEGEMLGVFEVASTTPHFYDDRHIQIAAVFGDRITQAVRNARLYEAERRRARAAEDLIQMRNDFVATVSHELRTPLTAIVGYTELLLAHWARLDDRRRLEQIQRIMLSASRQQRLVEDLLLLSRLDTRDLAAHSEVIPLAPLVLEAADTVRMSYPGQLIDLEGPDELLVLADPARVVQVLTNLIDNAAKYSPEGAPIAVQWSPEGELAAVRIRDRGPGIPEEGREQLFTRFGRLRDSKMRAGRMGTGLGLFLGRQLAEAMGGNLVLETSSPSGSTFCLRLPLPPAFQG